MKKILNNAKSFRFRLFFSLCCIVTLIIAFLILINNVVLETVYMYAKAENVKKAYEKINEYYNEENTDVNIEEELNGINMKNGFEILVVDNSQEVIYSSNKNLFNSINRINQNPNSNKNVNPNPDFIPDQNFIPNSGQNKPEEKEPKINFGLVPNEDTTLFQNDKYVIRKMEDVRNNFDSILLTATLDNGNSLYIRVQVESIQESVKLSNDLLLIIGGIAIIVTSFIASIMSRRLTKPIVELNDIAQDISELNFEKKYIEKGYDNEIEELGKNINIMSEKLENTINELRETNIELEKDIEEKSKIDEMRKQFISDVSHELKTPIALIQGYAEGLIENVNTDDESRKFYAEVILDESNKMDKLVKQLLELMKLEYGTREFNNTNFNIVELVKEVIRKCDMMIKESNIEINFNENKSVIVNADEFYVEQIVTNYFTNAIKNATEVNGKKVIEITIDEKEEKVRVSVFNTGKLISKENLERIWKRFYKVDESRNRNDGGTGIGLSIVKAIMNNYGNEFGAQNKENGVEFYFELNKENVEK